MKGEEQSFGICQHCGGALQFETALAGQTTACPHCGQTTTLTPGKLRSKSGAGLWIAASLFCLVIAAIALSFFLKDKPVRKKIKGEASQAFVVEESHEAAKPAETAVAEPEMLSVNGFDVGKVTVEKTPNSRLIYATGLVRNPLSQQRFGVRVEINLLDANGDQVGKATDYANVIEPKSEWKFKALVTTPTAVSGEIATVKENY